MLLLQLFIINSVSTDLVFMTMGPKIEQEYNFALIDNKRSITAKNTTEEMIKLPQSSYFGIEEGGRGICKECALLQKAG